MTKAWTAAITLLACSCSSSPPGSDAGSDATLDVVAEDVASDAGSDDSSPDCSDYVTSDATATSDAGCYLAGSPCINPFDCCSHACSAKSLDNGCEISVCAP